MLPHLGARLIVVARTGAPALAAAAAVGFRVSAGRQQRPVLRLLRLVRLAVLAL